MQTDAPLDESGTPEQVHTTEVRREHSAACHGWHTPEAIKEGCIEARKIIEWTEWAGFDETGQQMAPILLSGLWTQDSRLLHSLGGFDKDLISKVKRAANGARIWCGAGRIGSDWGNEKHGDIAFILDLMVVCGMVRRANSRYGPRYIKITY